MSPVPDCDALNTRHHSLSSANPPLKPVTSNKQKFLELFVRGRVNVEISHSSSYFRLNGGNQRNKPQREHWINLEEIPVDLFSAVDKGNLGTQTENYLLSDF